MLIGFVLKKITRRLRLIFIRLKHRFYFLCGLKPCWCGTDHSSDFVENFRPKIKAIFHKLELEGALPEWATDQEKLKKFCKHALDGHFELFLKQVYIGKKDFGWSQSCSSFGCYGCKLDFEKNQFSWDLWSGWSSALGKKNVLNPDIRIVWEKSRLQFLIPLALAQCKDMSSGFQVRIFTILSDWEKNNPFLTGPNWTSAMEAGIRAVNMIWLACLTRDERIISQLSRLLCLHGGFIKDCWEDFDRPNNHVIADAIGLAYLSAFFGKKDDFEWSMDQLKLEFERQINSDGSSYEGSTGYHRLVLEFFVHYRALVEICDFYDPLQEEKFEKMKVFFNWMHDQQGKMISVGDQDSSKFVFGLGGQFNVEKNTLKQKAFNDFGVWIFKDNKIFCSVTMPKNFVDRPSGHQHQDWLSMTLKIGRVNVFVDPGSGFYTQDRVLRNRMRSFASHSTFFPSKWLENLSSQDLFSLSHPKVRRKLNIDDGKFLCAYEAVDEGGQIFKLCRKVKFAEKKNGKGKKAWSVSVFDKVRCDGGQKMVWNFVLSPEVSARKVDDEKWLLVSGEKRFLFRANKKMILDKGFFASEYSKVVRTKILRIEEKSALNKKKFLSAGFFLVEEIF